MIDCDYQGMVGGEPGARGLNLWLKSDQSSEGSKHQAYADLTPIGYKAINLGGKNSVRMSTGDRLFIATPGGGGYGHVVDGCNDEEKMHFVKENASRDHDWKVVYGESVLPERGNLRTIMNLADG